MRMGIPGVPTGCRLRCSNSERLGIPLIESEQFLGFLVSKFLSFLVSWFLGFLVSWFLGCLVSWCPGFLASWFQSVLVLAFKDQKNFVNVLRRIFDSYDKFLFLNLYK